jgi:NADP-dependent 3-hydroxy acid dehydrogenase YdfG
VKSFKHKVAVITGAGSGIGQSMAVQLDQESVHLSLADIRSEILKEIGLLHSHPFQPDNDDITNIICSVPIEIWTLAKANNEARFYLIPLAPPAM